MHCFRPDTNYVMGNPVIFVDPDGKAPTDPPCTGSRTYFSPGIGATPNLPYVVGVPKAFGAKGMNVQTIMAHSNTLSDAQFAIGDNSRTPYYDQTESISGGAGFIPGTIEKRETPDWRVTSTVNQVKEDLANNPLEGGQLNLMGGSGGSVIMAQAALVLADEGQLINNVILMASPVAEGGELLDALRNHPNIGDVYHKSVQLNGDLVTGIGTHKKFVHLGYDMVRQGEHQPHKCITWDSSLWNELAEELQIAGIE